MVWKFCMRLKAKSDLIFGLDFLADISKAKKQLHASIATKLNISVRTYSSKNLKKNDYFAELFSSYEKEMPVFQESDSTKVE